MRETIYMDYHATTPVDPRVVESMLPYFGERFGNAASKQHRFGWVASEAVESARKTIGLNLNCRASEVIFTSGATESNNLAIRGTAAALRQKGRHLITVQTEHPSVLEPCRLLAKQGFSVTLLPVDSGGLLDPADLDRAITGETILVSVMAANNEIGTIQPLDVIGDICRKKNVLFHSDATQAVGKIPFDARADMISLSAHKMYGPKGIGALIVRNAGSKIRLEPLLAGGGHERGFRSGTLNVPGIVGMGRAFEISFGEMEEESARVAMLRDRLWQGLLSETGGVELNGSSEHRLPNNLNVSFSGVDENALMMSLKDIAVSTGSACSTEIPEPSHVLKALGVPKDRLGSSIRFGLGRMTTAEEVDTVIRRVAGEVAKLRGQSGVRRQTAPSIAEQHNSR